MKPNGVWAAAATALLTGLSGIGCIGDTGDADDAAAAGDEFASGVATLLEFEFDGEVVAKSATSWQNKVRAQLLFTVGQLNGDKSVSRLNAVKLTRTSSVYLGGGLYRIRYHAKLPVAWGRQDYQPADYTFTLPKRVDEAGQATFLSRYGVSCTDAHGHQVLSSNVWYHYRPAVAGCVLDPADVTTSVATVTPSTLNTSGKYPEYHRMWEDGVLDIVAVFGKEDKGATAQNDAGIAAYNEFIRAIRSRFPGAATTPISVPVDPGVAVTDITFDIETDAGRVSIVLLLSDEVQSAPASFDKRFAEVTPRADLLLYGGHAGLGANVRALTAKAKFFPGKYQLFFLNGCDTFAYEDDALNNARKLLNPSDPGGSKYMDVMRNAMPAYFHMLSEAAMAVINASVEPDYPSTYEEIFADIDPKQVVLVTGEEDNVFTPSLDLGARWEGASWADAVGYKQTFAYASEQLPAGKYVFELGPEPSAPGGDADLYVRVGSSPTATSTYKCPSYKFNSNERCTVTLASPAIVHTKVVGDEGSMASQFELRAWQLNP
jgi:hypothetical protein